ncbi:MAG: VWA domain-containing protein [Anaerolineaceae bacterium]|nr:MAG: VWA domain-containing protein [Anaerolineaceae bacterium]
MNRKKGLLILCLTILMGSCSPLTIDPIGTKTAGWLDWDGEGGWGGASKAVAEGGLVMDLETEGLVEAPKGSMAIMGSSDETDWSSEEPRDGDVSQRPNLRAGSVDDNAEWDDYLLYRLRFAEWNIRVHDIDVSERHIIQITNGQGQPVLGTKVTISDDAGRELGSMYTHADGKVLFFPLASSSPDAQLYQILAEKGSASADFTLNRNERDHTLVLDTPSAKVPVRLDVHFLIDATGSMSDEIEQLKANMITISERIHALPSSPDVRFGMTIYRDRGDLFVSRTFEFTPDIERFTEELRNIAAEGGGDYAESLNEGLHNAIHLPEWRVDDTVSLIFLVADAPPHLDYANDYDYAEDVFEAVERGIKIFPLASSGLDDQGEYIFRQLAQISAGKFLFLTYGAGGAPGDETPHHVDDYSVLSLDELVVRLVEEELAQLSLEQ